MNSETGLMKPEPTFEDFKNENGVCYWWASDLMTMLGYQSMKSFQKAIDRGIRACMSLGIPHYDNFRPDVRPDRDSNEPDFKLTRFACYLAVMNADPSKEAVANAQVYFAEQTRRFELFIQGGDQIDRILIREELKDGNKSLSGAAKSAGVADYGRFQNAGYLGLYNLSTWQLAKRRNVKPNELLEHMGRTELAANLFRVTQTEERIKTFNVRGQRSLEETHYNVGREVRGIVEQNTGRSPENLAVEGKLTDLHKELKQGYRKMLKEDGSNKSKKKNKPS